MTEITLEMIKELRARTARTSRGDQPPCPTYGVLDCRQALKETGGDIVAAAAWLRANRSTWMAALDTYTCARCGGEFGSDRSDEEARAEAVALWGPEALKPGVVVVCDDCFKFLTAPISSPRR